LLMNPLCDLCVKAGKFGPSTMIPMEEIGSEGEPVAYRCRFHHDREYRQILGYDSRQTGQSEPIPTLSVFDDCGSPLRMFIVSARSPGDVTLQCVACGEEQPFSFSV
jgi:hypothetical protein